jgi:hypothetical protein
MEKIKNLKGIENIEKWVPGITKEIADLIERANNGFTQGYTCACANLVRTTGDANGTLEVELLQANVSKLDDLRNFKCDESDIEVLLPTIAECERKRALACF